MARPLSRKGRLGVAFAGIAVGTGAVIVINDGHHPALAALIGMLGFVSAGTANLFWMGGWPRQGEERAWRRDRIARRAAAKTGTTTTKVRCLHCQHVQTVPFSQKIFACEQCNAHLKRRTAPAKRS